MLFFPEGFLHIAIIGALIMTAVGAVVLVALFIHDARKKQIW